MTSGWNGEMGISNPVPSRLGFFMESHKAGTVGTALCGGATVGGIWAHLKCKTGV